MASSPLFTPTLSDREPFSEPHPWRLPSLYLLAFFGGHLAAAFIAWQNTRRLGLGDAARRRIVWIEAAAMALSIAVPGLLLAYLVFTSAGHDPAVRNTVWEIARSARLLMKIPTLAFAALMVRVQTRADRLYQLSTGSDDQYASLWRPGLLAWLASLVVWLPLIVPWALAIERALGSPA